METVIARTIPQALGRQLGQLRPANTTAASIYSLDEGVVAHIQTILICDVSGAGASARVFLDDDGTTYDQTTALYYDVAVAANTTVEIEVNIYMTDSDGNLAVRTSVADSLTFTVFGTETQAKAR